MIRKTLLLALFGLAAVSHAQTAFDDALDASDESAGDIVDAADSAADDASSAADDAVASAEAAAAERRDIMEAAEAKPSSVAMRDPSKMAGDTYIGIMSTIGVIWWFIFGWFVYVKTNASDVTMRTTNWTNATVYDQIPLTWFWTSTNHPTMGWTAFSYLMIWLFYLIVSVIEWVGWMCWVTNDGSEQGLNGAWFYNMWASYVGLYGSWILYSLTWIFPAVQLSQINGVVYAAGFTNSITLLTVMALSWLAQGLMHIFYVPEINAKYEALEKVQWTSDCKCS